MNINYASHEERIICPHCKKELYSGDAYYHYPKSSVCDHVEYIHNSETVLYLSDKTKALMKEKNISEDNLNESLLLNANFYLRDIVEFPNSIEYEISLKSSSATRVNIAVSK